MKTTTALFGIFTITLALSPQAQGQSFTNTGSLNIGRGNQTATLLQNGTVLVAGGTTNGVVYGINPPTDSAEIYNPVSGMWTNAGAMSVARYDHTATLLANGTVLVADGVNDTGGSLASAELFNPVSGLWNITGTPNNARHGHTATLLTNGMVLIAGGYDANGALDSAELYDPDTQTWTNTGNLNFSRGHHAAALLANGEVLVAGGTSTNSLSSAELYDPVSGTWGLTGAMSVARNGMTATLLLDGTVLFAGGGSNIDLGNGAALSSAEIYSYRTGTWGLVGAMSTARGGAMATLLTTGNVLVAGGIGLTGNYLAGAELYNPLTKAWTTTGAMSVAREGGTATLLNDWRVLIAGGSDGVVYLASAELYLYPFCPPRTATATATLTNGSVVGATITDGGCGYTNTPLVVILGGGGTGATAMAVVSNGVVVNIIITDAGTGYTSAPYIYIYSPLGLQIGLKKAVEPTFHDLFIGTNYQLQVSRNLNTWTNQGSPFTATNPVMVYPQYFDVCDWGQLFFRLQASP
jgi:N-acetylneuraminic acid mutarotase